MKMTKRCEYILDDGHKCNQAFTTRATGQKYCESHIGNSKKLNHLQGHHSLVNSTNAYAGVANALTMQEWVKHKMNMENLEKKKIEDLENKIKRLETIIDKIASNKKVVKTVLREEMRGDYFITKIDSIVVKRLQKSMRFGRSEEE